MSVHQEVAGRIQDSRKTPVNLLEEVCEKNLWGKPVYELDSVNHRTAAGERKLFFFKVTIPGQRKTIRSHKLSRIIEEAEISGAEYVLSRLGVSRNPQYPGAHGYQTYHSIPQQPSLYEYETYHRIPQQ